MHGSCLRSRFEKPRHLPQFPFSLFERHRGLEDDWHVSWQMLSHFAECLQHGIGNPVVFTAARDLAQALIADPGANFIDPVDDQLLPVYNRAPDSFGRDRYLLSNSDQPATFRGVTLIVDQTTPRMFLGVGLAAGWTDAAAGNRGFGAAENDAGIVGELSTDPNAATHARGNLFSDRQYTGRIASSYRFAHDITVGAVARYQDGQPFSRMVVVADLNQGTDAVRAFGSGKSRFTFTGTLDIRVQKGVALPGGGRAALVIDGYNVLNLDKEVEEWVVTGPAFRTPTAAQPPRVIHLGLRLSF